MSQEKLKTTLVGVIEAIKEKPDIAKKVFRAETALVDDLRCTGKVREFDTLNIDEPTELGGSNTAMNPLEMALVALGTCQEIMYGAYAAVMGIPLDEVKVECKGNIDLRGLLSMDESEPSGFKKIQYKTTIKSPADDESIRQLVDTVESHCPMLDTLVRPIEVTGEVTINGTKK